MRLNQEQYDKIKHILPIQRGNVTINNLTLINALLYILENGCKWRRLPSEFGYWHAIYMRFSRRVKNGVIERTFKELHVQNILQIKPDALMMDSTAIKVHPDACGVLKKVASSLSDVPKAD